MSTEYVSKQMNTQKITSRAKSIFDFSSRSALLQCKVNLANAFAQNSSTSENNKKVNVVQCMGQDEIEKKWVVNSA